MEYRIRCVNKLDRDNPREKITHVGGMLSDGRNWKCTQKDIIHYIESEIHSFYVFVNGRRANVIVVSESRFGNKYIKTENDSGTENNLLSLPECV